MFVMTSIGGGEVVKDGDSFCTVKVPGKETDFNPESLWIFWKKELQFIETKAIEQPPMTVPSSLYEKLTDKEVLGFLSSHFSVANLYNKIALLPETPESFIAENIDKCSIFDLLGARKFSIEFLRTKISSLSSHTYISLICRYQDFTDDFISEFAHLLNWQSLCMYKSLSDEIINKFSHKIDWWTASRHQKLSEEMIEKYAEHVNWNTICMHQKLSEDFIRKHQDKMNWFSICEHQKLSEDFILEFADKIVWDNISKYQKLSMQFIKEFKAKLYLHSIIINQELDEEFIANHEERVVGALKFESLNETNSFFQRNKISDPLKIRLQRLLKL